MLVIVFLCFSLMGYAQRFFIPQQEEEYIPIPQVATETAYDKETGLGGLTNEVWTYEIPWSWQEIRRHFTNKMPDYGWISDSGEASYGAFFDKNSVMFKKGNKSLMITNIATFPSQERTTFSVNLKETPSIPEPDVSDLFGPSSPLDPSQGVVAFFENTPFTDMVKDVPVYPGASQMMARKQEDRVIGLFVSPAKKASIITFYNSAMIQRRWSLGYDIDLNELKGSMEGIPIPSAQSCPDCPENQDFIKDMLGDLDVYTMQFQKGNKQCTIVLMPLGGSGTTMINISYLETAD